MMKSIRRVSRSLLWTFHRAAQSVFLVGPGLKRESDSSAVRPPPAPLRPAGFHPALRSVVHEPLKEVFFLY